MEVKINSLNDVLYVKPSGRIDVNSAIEFGTKINDALYDHEEVRELVIDFEEVQYISSMGLRVLLELQKRMNETGSMKLAHVSDEIMEVFSMTGFNKILKVE